MGILRDMWEVRDWVDYNDDKKDHYITALDAYKQALDNNDGTLHFAFVPLGAKYNRTEDLYVEAGKNMLEIKDKILPQYIDSFDSKLGKSIIPNNWTNRDIPAHEIWLICGLYNDSVRLAATGKNNQAIAKGKEVLTRLRTLHNRLKDKNKELAAEAAEILNDCKTFYVHGFNYKALNEVNI